MFCVLFHHELKTNEVKNAHTIQSLPKTLILFEPDAITEILLTLKTCLV